jgi:hypothetical protein
MDSLKDILKGHTIYVHDRTVDELIPDGMLAPAGTKIYIFKFPSLCCWIVLQL